jgi:hypothetical protein
MSKFEKGNQWSRNGNGSGRPAGSRNKLANRFLDDLRAHWEVNGAAALDMCFKEDPVAYCKLVAGTVPRDYRIETTKITELADDELDRMISTLRERALAVRQDRALELEKAPEQKLLNGRQH